MDDEPAVGKAIGRLLHDHDVTVVARAATGLDLVAANPRFDLIITDLMMPEMSGMDFYEELARRFPDIAARVMFVTGGAFTPAAKAFLDRVKKPVLDKPFSPKQLRDQVERHLRR